MADSDFPRRAVPIAPTVLGATGATEVMAGHCEREAWKV